VELCLSELTGGKKILEIGYGSGVTFLSLHDKYEEIYGLDIEAKTDEVSDVFKKLEISVFLKNGNVLEMPYPDDHFDSVLLVSILEHLHPAVQKKAFQEITRVLKKNGQVVYGAPVERPLMSCFFRLLGYDIKKHHFSSEKQIAAQAKEFLRKVRINNIKLGPFGKIYEVGNFVKI
jgi:ubiquinone/menaquinone biosynthesis C-methylase UbiE